MGIYEKYFLPKLIHLAMKSPEFHKVRGQLIPLASGKVIEVGIGSGMNLPFYQAGVHVTGIDPSVELQQYAIDVARECKVDVEFLTQGCEALPLPDNVFDTAVITWTLCTVPHAHETLAEVRRVLKPNGQLIFSEHGLSPEPNIARWQRRLNPVWRKIGGGCNLNRKMDTLLQEGGFKFADYTEGYLRGPKFAAYTYRGVASIR